MRSFFVAANNGCGFFPCMRLAGAGLAQATFHFMHLR